ncbi:hypothetical protein KUTeg_021313 [Tegillarca granosa]|uniref:non-specific serine/threonine protein kinase n=1 Tax=Tegillarca granosa TaxID=220873 RepID=A0ABQ9ED27_TEGGR|nr:hypothetical protein KUTeg_021313 [Tegillarca granosa]
MYIQGVNQSKMAEGGCVPDRDYWQNIANAETFKGREYFLSQTADLQGDSTDTVLCLDISESMEGDAFQEMIKTAKIFIYGIMSVAKSKHQEENISIVTFGHETRIVSYLSKDYQYLIDTLDGLHAGGPSPMEGGLLLSVSSLLAKPMHNLQGYHIRPRIILMTDGLATPGVIVEGKDNQYIEFTHRVMMEINAVSTFISDKRYATYLNIVTENTGGKIIPAYEIQRLVHMTSNCIMATNMKHFHCIPGEDWKSIIQQQLGNSLSEKDFDYVVEWLWVQWDHGKINRYPYNASAGYGIVVVDEPRKLSAKNCIDVGISVVRGPSWKFGNDDGGPGNTGICFRKENNIVSVRWENGFIGQYRFGKEGCNEVEISDPRYPYTDQPETTFENRFFKPASGRQSDFEYDAEPVGVFEPSTCFTEGAPDDMSITHWCSLNTQDDLEETQVKTHCQSEDIGFKNVYPENNEIETSVKSLNEESCTNENNRMIIWKYFQSGTWKSFDSTLSDTLEKEYSLRRKTKLIQIENVGVKFTHMVMRNLQTTEEFNVEREESNIPQEVLAMDKEWIDLYKQSLIKGKEKVHNIRVMVVGPEGVGKTVLTRRLLKHYVDINQRQSTNGIDVHIEKCGTRISDGTWEFDKDKLDEAKRFENRLVNVMQQIPRLSIADNFDETENTITLHESPKEMLADNRSPEQNILPDLPEIEHGHGDEAGSFDIENTKPLMLESTTVQQEMLFSDIVKPKDLESENKEEIMKLIKDTFDKLEISEKEVLGEISFWDFGGQIVFYSTHQTFLTPRAVYIVVIDMSKALKNKVNRPCFTDKTGEKQWNYEDYLLFWLKSIKTYGSDNKGTVIPPIIIVATHLDKEGIVENPSSGEVEEALENKVDIFKKELYEELRCHSVRPLVDDFVAIDNTVEDDKNLERLRKAIVNLSSKQSHWGEEKPASWIFLEKKILEQKKENKKIISFKGIGDLNAQTEYPVGSETELQMFLTFHHAVGNIVYFNEEGLNKFIILNPQWLIDAFKSILTSDEFVIKNDQDTLKKWDDLDKLKTKLSSNELAKLTRGSVATPYFCFVFDDFLPSAVFHSLLAACMGEWPISKRDKTNLLYCGCGMFDLTRNKNHRLLICFVKNLIQLRIYRYDTTKFLPETKHCVDVRKFVEQNLKKILSRSQQCIKSTPYIRCKKASFDTTEGLLRVEELMEVKDLICHGHESKPSHSVSSFNLLKCWYADLAYKLQSSGCPDDYSTNEIYRFEECDRTPSEAELNRLAKKIGPKFKSLGLALGVTDSDIEAIKFNYRDDVASLCYEVLKKWIEIKGEDATLEYLERKMKEEHIDEKILSEAIDNQ